MRARILVVTCCLLMGATAVVGAGPGRGAHIAGAATVRNAGVMPSAGCGTSAIRAGEATLTTTSSGVERTYIRHVPPAHDGVNARPLVVDIHGLGQGAALQNRNSDWAPRADRDGIVVVYPQGINSTWRLSTTSPDVAYIGQLLDEAEAQLCIDTNRIYVTGFSLGAFMTSAVACVYADRVAAVAPVAGLIVPGDCARTRPVPALTIHGTDDNWVPYGPIPANVAGWAQRNSCSTPPAEQPVPGDDVVTITKFTYPCPASAEVEFYSIEGGGHAWPGSEFSRAIEAAVRYTTFAINATDLIWDFFRQHQLQPDIATYTARFTAAEGEVLSRIATASGTSIADLVRVGVNALRAVADAGLAVPAPQSPNTGPHWVTVSWPAEDAAVVDHDAAAWGATGDELHNAGGRLVNLIVYLAAIGRL